MYLSFFGLQHAPFSIAPDPRYLYMSERHREALAHLLYGVRGGGGFVLLTGEIGAGKTTVCRCWLEKHIWQQASRWPTDELAQRASGEVLNPAHYRAHLEGRYLA